MYPCIHLWQKNSNICLHPTPTIFLPFCPFFTLHSLILQTPCPSCSRWAPFFPPFQSNLSMIDGGFGLTTCLWMLGMASMLSRIFFYEGVNQRLLLPVVDTCSAKRCRRRRGEEIRFTLPGFKACSLQIVAWNFKIDTFVWMKKEKNIPTSSHSRLCSTELERRK